MTYWHLLWMFLTASGFSALVLATPFLWSWAGDGHERAWARQMAWRQERRRRQETAKYGQPLRACLYCGSVCEFGPGCFNRELAVKAAARGTA